jgi:hypothetical protein
MGGWRINAFGHPSSMQNGSIILQKSVGCIVQNDAKYVLNIYSFCKIMSFMFYVQNRGVRERAVVTSTNDRRRRHANDK